MSSSRNNKQELMVYALLWIIVFAAPLLSYYVRIMQGEDLPFHWSDIFAVWRQYTIFFVVFLIHNFLLAPLLVGKQRRWLYFSLVAVLMAAFVAVQCAGRPHMPDAKPMMSLKEHHHEGMPSLPDDLPPLPDGMSSHPEDMPLPPDAGNHPGDRQEMHRPGKEPRHGMERPPLVFGQHDLVAIIIMVLMLGMNLGVKFYFRNRIDRERLTKLEKENLEQQLEYLRYQINPHFLMNTLNNIHALIDIDGERAKESILALSKIMRFVLYEGAKQMVPLNRELEFTKDYIELMRMRVTDRVTIDVSMPQRAPERQIPPLVLITFVENAFKHGVSYLQESFIDIVVTTKQDSLTFICRNSKVSTADDQHGGVGLKNVRQRLDLLFGKDYSLTTEDQTTTFYVNLTIPLT